MLPLPVPTWFTSCGARSLRKRAYKSWTVLFNLGLLAITLVWPKLGKAVCDSPELTIQLVVLVNLLLRFKTKAPIILLGVILSACSSVPQKLDPETFHKRDLPFCVDDIGCFEGVTVLPQRASYTFEVAPKGDANIDLLVATSCHREETFEKTASGWFIFQKKNRFKYPYTPAKYIEDDGDCALMMNTLEADKGRHAWMLALFEHPKYQLPATLSCNGQPRRTYQGVSVCQSKVGLSQRIEFDEPVMIEHQANCNVPTRNGTGYEWKLSEKQCRYTFLGGHTNRMHALVTLGYNGVLVREMP